MDLAAQFAVATPQMLVWQTGLYPSGASPALVSLLVSVSIQNLNLRALHVCMSGHAESVRPRSWVDPLDWLSALMERVSGLH